MPTPATGVDTRLTYDDLQQFPDDGLRHELIDGVHYVTASPNLRHQIVLGRTVCVEVLSPSTRKRDVQLKRRLFEKMGVREYWILDPEIDTVQVFRQTSDSKYERAAELAAEDGDALTSPLLPGFSLALPELFCEGL